jgi:hypothetical protein
MHPKHPNLADHHMKFKTFALLQALVKSIVVLCLASMLGQLPCHPGTCPNISIRNHLNSPRLLHSDTQRSLSLGNPLTKSFSMKASCPRTTIKLLCQGKKRFFLGSRPMSTSYQA